MARATSKSSRGPALQPDPGRDAILRDLQRVGTHRVGARLNIYVDGELVPVTIDEGYGLHAFRCATGPYLASNGDRIGYQFGYIALVHLPDGDQRMFVKPGDLLDPQTDQQTHLRLVQPA